MSKQSLKKAEQTTLLKQATPLIRLGLSELDDASLQALIEAEQTSKTPRSDLVGYIEQELSARKASPQKPCELAQATTPHFHKDKA